MTAQHLRAPLTTESVREQVAWQDNYPHEGEHNPVWAAAFDRWLVEHDRQVAEKAWGEGYIYAYPLGFAEAQQGSEIETEAPNPYRQTSDGADT